MTELDSYVFVFNSELKVLHIRLYKYIYSILA